MTPKGSTSMTEAHDFVSPVAADPADVPEVSIGQYILESLHSNSRLNSSKPWVIDAHTGVTVLFSQIEPYSKKIASGLARLGFCKDVLHFVTYETAQLYLVQIAVWRLGGAVRGCYQSENTDEYVRQLKETGARFILVDDDTEECLQNATALLDWPVIFLSFTDLSKQNIVSIQNLLEDDGSAFPSYVDIDCRNDTILIPNTSGSTGVPKGVLHTHYSMIAFNHHPKALEHLNFDFMTPMSNYAMGSYVVSIASLLRGSTIIHLGKFHRDNYVSNMLKYKVYASTETLDISNTLLDDSPEKLVYVQHNGQLCLSSGKLLPYVEAKIVDINSGVRLGGNEIGEICIRSPYLTKGYLSAESTTGVHSIKDKLGWLHTGDVGFFDTAGRIFVTERLGFMFKYFMFMVSPTEIEAVLQEHPGVQSVGVVGVPNEETGYLAKAFVDDGSHARASVEVEVTGPNDYSKNSYKAVLAQILVVAMALAKNSSIPTTEEDGSWIASIHSIFTPIGALISGPIMERLGRRPGLIISIFPGLIGWICIALSESHLALFIGRSFTGLSTGLSLAPGVVIIGESAEPRLRGILVGAPSISFSLGILMIYTLNSALPWQTVSLLATILPLVALVSLFFLPESPLWLERVGRTEEAQKAMTWLRGGSEHQARHELLLLKQQQIQNVLFEEAHSTARKSSPLLSRPVLRALIVINVFNIFLVLGGTYTIIFYAVNVLQQSSGDSISAFEIAVSTAIARVLLTTLACFLLLHVGRRPLTISSGLGSSVAALGVSAWLYWSPKLVGYEWVPTALVLAFVVFNSYGFFTIQALMLGEMLPARARGPSSGLTCALVNAVIFFTSKTYPWMTRVFQPHVPPTQETQKVKLKSMTTNSFYAAVVEFSPKGALNNITHSVVEENLREYQKFIEHAKSLGADIIVFPEYGLTTIEPYNKPSLALELSQFVPDPDGEKISPCDLETNELDLRVVHKLSCLAKQNQIYLVVNLIQKVIDKSEILLFNTNVVFDRNGKVIARYRKFHLFGEIALNHTDVPDNTTFITDFGVTFGVITCFDLMFRSPTVDLVRKFNVDAVVFPTAWFSELPFLTASQAQAAWAAGMQVSLLASGINNPKDGSTGTGVYQPGAFHTTRAEFSRDQLWL
ncbi:Hypothetical predicted protein [Cloeon dipterum]|uniref:Major facilitator superfamily (MFS) profile domain-containing protein n=1 Tax=Cloeon dipterum TaxID=197152 RepID=A0A8S1BL72_9INSE|nr:Hypothetical predicted protein [Cloeon dipterum]